MKYQVKNIALLALAFWAVVSCSKYEDANLGSAEDGNTEFNPTDGIPRYPVKLSFECALDDVSQTRAGYADEMNRKMTWSKRDKVGMFQIANASEIVPVLPENVYISEAVLVSEQGYSTGKFKSSIPINLSRRGTYGFFYPKQTVTWKSGKASTISVGHSSPRVREANEMNKYGWRNIGDYAFATCVMPNIKLEYSGEYLTPMPDQTLEIGKMKHHVAFFEIPLNNLAGLYDEWALSPEFDIKVDSVVFKVTKREAAPLWSNDAEMDWSTQTLTPVGADGDQFKSIVVKTDHSLIVPREGESDVLGKYSIHFTTLPVKDVDQYEIRVYMNQNGWYKAVHTCTSLPGVKHSFNAGQRYTLSLDHRSDTDFLDHEGLYGQEAHIYYGDRDTDNEYVGDGWVDNYDESANLDITCFSFTPTVDISILAPNSGDTIRYTSKTSIPEWRGKKSTEISNSHVTVKAGERVTIALNLAKGSFSYRWDVTRLDKMIGTQLLLNRQPRVSPRGDSWGKLTCTRIFGEKLIKGNRLFNVSTNKSKIIIRPNAQVFRGVGFLQKDKDLGYTASELSILNQSYVKCYYYVTQIGSAIANTAIKLGQRKNNDFVYYIENPPVSGTDDSDYLYTKPTDIVFMPGCSEGLSLNRFRDDAPFEDMLDGMGWNAISNKKSFSPKLLTGYSRPGSSEGLYSMQDKSWEMFATLGKESPCDYVFPAGTWREPSRSEVESWNTDTTYPTISSYGKLNLGSATVSMPRLINRSGVVGHSADAKSCGLHVGSFFYLSNRTWYTESGGNWFSTYPMMFKGFWQVNSAPYADYSDMSQLEKFGRDAASVLCVRK